MRHLRSSVVLGVVLAIALAACSSDSSNSSPSKNSSNSSGSEPVTVTLVTHDSFAVSNKVLRDFEHDSGITVKVLRSGDAGAALNQVILTRDHPLGDVFFGVDNTLLSRAEEADVFTPVHPAALDHVDPELRLDPESRLVPVDYGDVCVNDDKSFFEQKQLAAPETLDDLTKPEYRNLLVTENAQTSSPGLAFLLATVAKFGPDGYLDYWRKLKANGVQVVDGWEQAYNTEFSGSAGKGPRPLVVSYGSSPPAEVIYADPTPKTAPTGVLADTCFRQVEFTGVLRGTEHPEAAAKVVDFLLGPAFQADVPLQMFVYPSVTGTPMPSEFTKYAVIPEHPATLTPDQIAAHRDEWVDAWANVVLG